MNVLPKNINLQGYVEGYYGRLLSWSQRETLLDTMVRNQQNAWLYAPKEDPCHRMNWRVAYGQQWRESFRAFCRAAAARRIEVIGGVAPGLDFDFSQLEGGADYARLLKKYQGLLDDGAVHLALLMDDIDADFHMRDGGIASEGEAHALLANRLSEALGMPLFVTPRIYSNDLAVDEPAYLQAFLDTLGLTNIVLYCGSDVVAKNARAESLDDVVDTRGHALVTWDNLYANDYCPRRLFVGPWSGRESAPDVLLNPTGYVYTDCLLLDMMATCRESDDMQAAWQLVMARHAVPDCFSRIAQFFWHPVFNDQNVETDITPDASMLDAIEMCLWRWKTPLSREWYPHLFGLKHDLQLAAHQLPELRVRKTQTAPLARLLLDSKPAY